MALTAAAVLLWAQLSLLEGCHRRIEQAFAALKTGASPGARREMKLHAAPGVSLMYITSGRRSTGRRQCALSWELRAATSLVQLLRDCGRSADMTVLPSQSVRDLPKDST